MALFCIDDIDTYILSMVDGKTIVRSASVNKYTVRFFTRFVIYQELCSVKNTPSSCKFDSYDMINQYYQHNAINMLKLHQLYHSNGFYTAAVYGHLDILKWLHMLAPLPPLPPATIIDTIKDVIKKGHLHILIWLAETGYITDYQKAAYHAIKHGLRHIIDWFINMRIIVQSFFTNLDLDALTDLIDGIAENGYTDILTLLPRLQHTTNAIDRAAENGHLHVLEWFDQIDHNLSYTSYAIDWAARNGHIHILEWFKNSDYKFVYTTRAINSAAKFGHIDVLAWFVASGIPLKYNAKAINGAAKNGHLHILNWFASAPTNLTDLFIRPKPSPMLVNTVIFTS